MLPADGPVDAKQVYQAHSLQQRLRFSGLDMKPPPKKVPRCAFLEGFSLHANTHLHGKDGGAGGTAVLRFASARVSGAGLRAASAVSSAPSVFGMKVIAVYLTEDVDPSSGDTSGSRR